MAFDFVGSNSCLSPVYSKLYNAWENLMEVRNLEWISQNEQKIFELSPNKIKPFTCFGLRLRKVSGKNFVAGIQDFKMWEYAGKCQERLMIMKMIMRCVLRVGASICPSVCSFSCPKTTIKTFFHPINPSYLNKTKLSFRF